MFALLTRYLLQQMVWGWEHTVSVSEGTISSRDSSPCPSGAWGQRVPEAGKQQWPRGQAARGAEMTPLLLSLS